MHLAPPVGWYPTSEGSHERYWDGSIWSSPRERRPTGPLAAPESPPEPDTQPDTQRSASGQPTHVYRDLPAYADCPPYRLRTHDEIFESKHRLGSPVAIRRRRALFSGLGLAWLVALWPAAATSALVAADVAQWSVLRVDMLMIALLATWFALALTDTAIVRSAHRAMLFSRRPSSLSWWWAVCPPAQLLARTRTAHATRLLPVALVLSLLYPVTWLLPLDWLDAFAQALAPLVG